MTDQLEEFWDNLLSEEPPRIMTAWLTLDPDSQAAMVEHLEYMVIGEGWLDSQRESAKAALNVIKQDSAGVS